MGLASSEATPHFKQTMLAIEVPHSTIQTDEFSALMLSKSPHLGHRFIRVSVKKYRH
jgi:hypothetical protein